MENPAILLRRLNPYCARAMEGAASLCQTRTHAEILPEHWLLKLLEQGEGDLTVLARRYEWDMDGIWQDLLNFLEKLPRSVRGRPQLSDSTQTLMQDAWLRASLAGEEQIRSIHLLMALVDRQSLVRCDGLWPLLTLGVSQLERLRPLLDAQSDEREEVQQEEELAQGGSVPLSGSEVKEGELPPALQNALDKFTLDVTANAREGKIDPVFGRDTEIRQMVDILSRRRKNNPILVGEPGVGKTALVEGLALRIAEGNVPESLKTVSLLIKNTGIRKAGTGSMQGVMKSFESSTFDEKFIITQPISGKPLANQNYDIHLPDGKILSSVTDSSGNSSLRMSKAIDELKIVLKK